MAIDRTLQEVESLPLKKPEGPLCILMVDDEPVILDLYSSVLSRVGYQVDTAQDGLSAWEALQLKKYDLLVTDHQMIPMTGLQLIKKVHAAKMDVPVIMASSAIPVDELNRHPWLKIKGMLMKPFSVEALTAEVEKALRVKPDDTRESLRA